MKSLLVLLLAGSAFGQQAGNITVTGTCNSVSNGSNNVFNMTCGIGEAQGRKLLAISNQILAKEAKLDEIKNLIEDLRKDLALNPAVQIGEVNIQPGGALSVNQTGGTTIGTLNVTPKKLARHIPQDIQEQMVRELEKTPGEVTITSFVGDTEAYALATEIQSVFKRAKWTLKGGDYIASMMMGGKPWTGIRAELPMNVKPGDSVNLTGWRWEAVRVFRAICQHLSLEFLDGALPGERDEEVRIVVGPQAQ